MNNSIIEMIILLKNKGLENEVESLLYKDLGYDGIERLKYNLNKLIIDSVALNKSR